MLRAPARLAVVGLALLLSGCSAPAATTSTAPTVQPATIQTDLIVPGKWDVRGNTDHILAWVHNAGPLDVPYTWNLTLVGGQPLPAGWAFSAFPPEATLSPAGSRLQRGSGYSYGDWHRAMLDLTIPGDLPPGLYTVELHVANVTKPIELLVHPQRGLVSALGDSVEVRWSGYLQEDGRQFANGTTVADLGSGELLPGFEAGLAGLQVGESARLVVPPAFAYGYDVPDGHEAQALKGKWLEYDVTLLRFV